MNVEPSLLRSHVQFFDRRGYRFVTSSDLLTAWPRRAVWLTFDDAYESAVSSCLSQSVIGSFYVVAGLVGGASSWDGDRARPLADWALIKSLRKTGCEVGNHSYTHPRFADLSDELQAREIEQAHGNLAAHGFSTQSFCFPYGSLSASSTTVLAECGYSVGLALGKRMARPSDSLLALPRIVVAYSDKLPKLLYKLYVRPLLP